MKLRSAPFQNYRLPAFEGEGGGGGDPPKPEPKKPDLPPSKHDGDLPPKQDTFDRAYVEELRSENKTWRGKMVSERTLREAAEREATEAKTAAEAAKTAAEAVANGKVTEAEKRANDRVIRAELKTSALKAGMIDLDGLKLADISKVTLEEDGTVKGADELMTALKEAKPYLFGAAHKGSSNPDAAPKPGDGSPKKAKEMSEAERESFLNDHKKKFA